VLTTMLDAALWPIRWAIEAVLVMAHALLGDIGFQPDAGITWVLAVVVLLLLVRLLVLPLAIAATKNAQKMVLLTDARVAVRARYTGDAGADARQRRSAELRTLRRSTDANQLKSVIPQLVQVPIFFALYSVLRAAQTDRPGVGPLTRRLAESFSNATVLDVPFRDAVLTAHGSTGAIVLGLSLTLIVGVAQFVAQAVTLRYNITAQARRSPIWRLRPTPLFIAPPILVITSLAVPIGLLVYLTASSLWTLGQLLLLLRVYPLPTTEAHAARQARIGLKARARLG